MPNGNSAPSINLHSQYHFFNLILESLVEEVEGKVWS